MIVDIVTIFPQTGFEPALAKGSSVVRERKAWWTRARVICAPTPVIDTTSWTMCRLVADRAW